jgi:hypothetical protein
MSKYKTVHTEVEVEVSLEDFATEDLIDELEDRGSMPADASENAKELIEKIWQKRRLGKDNYQAELDQLIYQVLGHVL